MSIYIIGMPIGNKKDITIRALETFSIITDIYAEDTRSFREFAKYHNIKIKNIYSYEDNNEKQRSIEIISKIKNNSNKNIGIVSEAGTPLISDPGFRIIKLAHENNIKVIVIPGVSAITSCLSIAPMNGSSFTFLGFFYNYKLKDIYNSINTIVFFDSPKRILKTLNFLKIYFPNSYFFIGRELTKKFETYYYFPISEIPEINLKGEFVVVMEKNHEIPKNNIEISNDTIINLQKKFSHINKKDLAKIISTITNYSINDIYNKLIQFKM
ncbi:16S rRNA (cytidine(1402)-2'-O)-methyltransferase [Rickettsiales bacterium (ex Bugula neritina AB1)]|nr:16S rRNA (cytidine(1402)-2'-O)-methyltransferase [Rickettsiales bacterium (ex Bugula neritina AB1)]